MAKKICTLCKTPTGKTRWDGDVVRNGEVVLAFTLCRACFARYGELVDTAP